MKIDREDILITRIVDDEAGAEDWAEFERLAESDPGVWRRLARTQREQADLSAAVEEALTASDEVELPRRAMVAAHAFSARWRAWSGWAAAAAIALVWATTQGLPPAPTSSNNGQTASLGPAAWTPDEAFDRYIAKGKQEGRVLSELPSVMVRSRPTPDGKRFEVIILRRVMERAVVNKMYSVGHDDAGQPRLVPISCAQCFLNRRL